MEGKYFLFWRKKWELFSVSRFNWYLLGLVGLIRSFFKKGNKKRNFIIIGTAFILMIFGASISPTSHSDSSKASTQSEKRSKQKEHQVLLVKNS